MVAFYGFRQTIKPTPWPSSKKCDILKSNILKFSHLTEHFGFFLMHLISVLCFCMFLAIINRVVNVKKWAMSLAFLQNFLYSECFPTFIIPSRNLMFALLPWLLCIKLLKINFPRSENDWKRNIKFKKWQNRQSCFSLIFRNNFLIDINLKDSPLGQTEIWTSGSSGEHLPHASCCGSDCQA